MNIPPKNLLSTLITVSVALAQVGTIVLETARKIDASEDPD